MTAWTLPGGSNRGRRLGPGVLAGVMYAGLLVLGVWLMQCPVSPDHDPLHALHARRHTDAAAVMNQVGIVAHEVPDLPGASGPHASYAVRIGGADTPAGAILRLRNLGPYAPAGTYGPGAHGTTGGYQVVAGAFVTSNEASALLRTLRAHGQLSETSGTVVSVPLAFLIERNVAAGAVAARVADLAARGIPAYALRQDDDRAWLYAGAFATAADTAGWRDLLRHAGVTATLAYRTGRPF